MVAKAGLVVLDSNVFVIDLRYPRDRNYRHNQDFLTQLPGLAPAATTLVNVLEVCGILSFNLTAQQVRELYHYLPERYQVTVLPILTEPGSLPGFPVEHLLALMAKRLSFGDALVLAAIEMWIPRAACFVSWNAKHFRGKIALPVKTPEEFLEEAKPARHHR